MADSTKASKKHTKQSTSTPSKAADTKSSKKSSSAKAAAPAARTKDLVDTPQAKATPKTKSKKAASTPSKAAEKDADDKQILSSPGGGVPLSPALLAKVIVPPTTASQAPPVQSPVKEKKPNKSLRFAGLSAEAKRAKRDEERQAFRTIKAVTAPSKALAVATAPPSSTAVTVRKPSKSAQKFILSPPTGGIYNTSTLLFTPDEKFVILSQGPSIKVFSTKTSLLHRTLQHLHPPPTPFAYKPRGNYSNIAAYTLDPRNPSQLYTLTFAGSLLLWDWTEGTIEGFWETDLKEGQYLGCCGLVSYPSFNKDDVTQLWTYHEVELQNKSSKTVREIRSISVPTTFSSTTPTTLLSTIIHTIEDTRPRRLIIPDITTFIVDSGDVFYIGSKPLNHKKATWTVRKISTPNKITSIDAIIRSPATKSSPHPQGDVAVGDNKGHIYIYHSVLSPSQTSSAVQPQAVKSKHHWHRTAVLALKYTPDGTYLLSGGRETVLLIWQLSTGGVQHLPNLGAAIKHISLAPTTGTTYALWLADNSCMGISTTELKPTFSISGIQSRVFVQDQIQKIYQPGGKVVHTVSQNPLADSNAFKIPCTTHPFTPHHLLLATPTQQRGDPAYPYLQTFDTRQDRGVAKQAITRTLVSMKNVSPEGNKIKEPSVTHMSISSDGHWLATVDEWAAPAADFVDVGGVQPRGRGQKMGREVVVRFWRWSSASADGSATTGGTESKWELVSVVDAPHGVLASGSAGTVEDMASSPRTNSFATIGSDGTVKIWASRARTRAGVTVEKSDMVVWSCRRNVELFKTTSSASTSTALSKPTSQTSFLSNTSGLTHGRIAYAPDGSVIAVSYSDTSDSSAAAVGGEEGVVVLIDPSTGTVQQEISALRTGRIYDLKFLQRWLIIAGAERVVIWDLVAGVAGWTAPLEVFVGKKMGSEGSLREGGFVPGILLAVSGRTVGVSVNYPVLREVERRKAEVSAAGNTGSRVTVLTPGGDGGWEVTGEVAVVNGVLGLLGVDAGTGGGGYWWIDGAANVRFLGSGGVAAANAAGGDRATRGGLLAEIGDGHDVGGLANAFLEKAVITPNNEGANDDDGEWEEGKVVRSEKLAELWSAPAYAGPSVADVFGRFMEIVAEKPLGGAKLLSGADDVLEGVGATAVEKMVVDDHGEEEEGDVSMSGVDTKDVFAGLPEERNFAVVI